MTSSYADKERLDMEPMLRETKVMKIDWDFADAAVIGALLLYGVMSAFVSLMCKMLA